MWRNDLTANTAENQFRLRFPGSPTEGGRIQRVHRATCRVFSTHDVTLRLVFAGFMAATYYSHDSNRLRLLRLSVTTTTRSALRPVDVQRRRRPYLTSETIAGMAAVYPIYSNPFMFFFRKIIWMFLWFSFLLPARKMDAIKAEIARKRKLLDSADVATVKLSSSYCSALLQLYFVHSDFFFCFPESWRWTKVLQTSRSWC